MGAMRSEVLIAVNVGPGSLMVAVAGLAWYCPLLLRPMCLRALWQGHNAASF